MTDAYDPITDSSAPLNLEAKQFTEHTVEEQTRVVPISVFLNGKKIIADEWDDVLWVETAMDMMSLSSESFRDKRVLIVKKTDWTKGAVVQPRVVLKCYICGKQTCRGECDEDRFLGLID